MNARSCLFFATLILSWAISLVAADDATKEVREATITADSSPPVGRLGVKLGEYITIEGLRSEAKRAARRYLVVDTVNGKKLKEPVVIKIENANLPMGLRCTLKGYENGHMIGEPPALLAAAKETGDDVSKLGMLQAGWQWSAHFVVLVSAYPEKLEFERPKR